MYDIYIINSDDGDAACSARERERERDTFSKRNNIPIWRLNSPLAPSHSPRLLTDHRRHRAALPESILYLYRVVLLAVIYIGTAAVTDYRATYIYICYNYIVIHEVYLNNVCVCRYAHRQTSSEIYCYLKISSANYYFIIYEFRVGIYTAKEVRWGELSLYIRII